ncbi:MAG: HAMP domain-containing sensor histidine kinase [Thioalkalispiraceae bacterium]|jgi:signal transduction histidine kinase
MNIKLKQSKLSLRYRVTLAFALLGAVVSLTLAASFYVTTIDMEQRLIEETLSAELEDYIGRYAIDPHTLPPASTMLRTYVISPDAEHAPAALARLRPGLHHVQLDGHSYFAEVRLRDAQHFIVLYNDEHIRHRENQFKLFFAIGVTLMTLLSGLLGYWLAGRVILPVGKLARQVAQLLPRDEPARLAGDLPRDEVGILAREFDAYQQRLAAFIDREQSFTSDVSHELRTPLAVIKGAAEVLLDDPDLDDARRSRVERILRSTQEMSALVSALLLLAREETTPHALEGCPVAEILEEVVAAHQHLLQQKAVQLKLAIEAQPVLPVECTLLRIVLANLLRNAMAYTKHGQITVSLDASGITVTDTGIGISPDQVQRIFERFYSGSGQGEGIGLSLVRRICQRYGWQIDIDSQAEQGTTFRLAFQAS